MIGLAIDLSLVAMVSAFWVMLDKGNVEACFFSVFAAVWVIACKKLEGKGTEARDELRRKLEESAEMESSLRRSLRSCQKDYVRMTELFDRACEQLMSVGSPPYKRGEDEEAPSN